MIQIARYNGREDRSARRVYWQADKHETNRAMKKIQIIKENLEEIKTERSSTGYQVLFEWPSSLL